MGNLSMKFRETSGDTVIIDASRDEKFNLAGVLRQSLIIRQGGFDIGTYSGVPRDGIESIAQTIEDQVRDEGLKLPEQEVRDINAVFRELKRQHYDISNDYGGYPHIDDEIATIVEHLDA